MSGTVQVCDVDPDLKELLRKFRFRKAKENAAIIMKIDPQSHVIRSDEELEDCTVEEVAGALPEHQPRYVAFSYEYTHDDGRISYPLCFIFMSPAGCKPEQQMMYAGSKLNLVREAEMTKVFELRSVEEFTEEWLKGKLSSFR